MKAILIASLLFVASGGAFAAGEKSFLLHNGSEIVAVIDGTAMSLYYEKPKPGLRSAGVDQGTLLFRGEIKDGRIKGMAFAFRKGCAPTPYPVEGLTGKGDIGFELTGAGPVFRPNCKTEGTSWKSPHSRLIFGYDSQYDDK